MINSILTSLMHKINALQINNALYCLIVGQSKWFDIPPKLLRADYSTMIYSCIAFM